MGGPHPAEPAPYQPRSGRSRIAIALIAAVLLVGTIAVASMFWTDGAESVPLVGTVQLPLMECQSELVLVITVDGQEVEPVTLKSPSGPCQYDFTASLPKGEVYTFRLDGYAPISKIRSELGFPGSESTLYVGLLYE